MRAVDRFIARVDSTPDAELTDREIRTRLELLTAELEQLVHDEAHVRAECYGQDKWFHLRGIERERSAALERETRLTKILGART